MVKHSEIISFLYLHIPLLCGSWDHQRILSKQPKWKYDSWFPSEVSKLTSARNKLNLSLKYWFLKANVVFWICYGHKKGSKYHLDTIQTTFCKNNSFQRAILANSIFFIPENALFQGCFAEVSFTTYKENQLSYFQNSYFFKIFWWSHDLYN